MIKITIYRDENDCIVRYMVSGHANYDEYGKDIVCAAVSVLTQSTLMALVEVAKISEDRIAFTINDEDGFLDVEILEGVNLDKLENAQIILKSLLVGLESIIDSYPEYVTLEYREV